MFNLDPETKLLKWTEEGDNQSAVFLTPMNDKEVSYFQFTLREMENDNFAIGITKNIEESVGSLPSLSSIAYQIFPSGLFMHNDIEKMIEGFELKVGDSLKTILDPNKGSISFTIIKADK